MVGSGGGLSTSEYTNSLDKGMFFTDLCKLCSFNYPALRMRERG